MRSLIRGAIHLHSTYSDGEFALPQLREAFLSAGCAFACMTDHAEAFDANKLAAYVAECDALSDNRFRFIAGLEYECQNRMHILGYGVTSLLGTTAPQDVIEAIENLGGVSVIAHPKDAHFSWIETFERLPSGIETWNSKHDGRYAPRPQTFALLHRLQKRKPEMHAFYGQDLHWRKQFRGLWTLARCQAPEHKQILSALRGGTYIGVKGNLNLPSSGELPQRLLTQFATLHGCSSAMRRLMKGMKGWMDRHGAPVPSPVKAQLRRLL